MSVRLRELEEQARRSAAHLAQPGAYFSGEQRANLAREARACLGSHRPSFKLPPDLAKAVHLIVNFQSKCTAEWYRTSLVPAAVAWWKAEEGDGALLYESDDDCEGIALEIVGICCIAVAVALLELGMAARDHGNINDLEVDQHHDHQGGPHKALRATVSAKQITRTPSTGWAPYIDGLAAVKPDLAEPAKSTVEALAALAGEEIAFMNRIPFKSLSMSIGDHAHCFDLKKSLYLLPRDMMDFSKGRKGLNRCQMETVAAAYTAGRQCDF